LIGNVFAIEDLSDWAFTMNILYVEYHEKLVSVTMNGVQQKIT